MPGIKDPIKLNREQIKKLDELEGLMKDYEFEMNRAKMAGIEDLMENKKEDIDIQKIKRCISGIKRVYI